MKYILDGDERRDNAIEHIKLLDLTKPIEVHIKPYKKNRTKSQNDLIWAYYAVIGDHMGMKPDELHELMKVRVLGTEEKVVNGRTLIYPKSSTTLSTKEMAEFISAIEMLAVELGLKLPVHDDKRYATFMEK